MNAATPEGTPLRRIGDVKLLRTCPPCLEETRGEGHRNIAYFFYLKNNFHGFDVTASSHAGFSETKKTQRRIGDEDAWGECVPHASAGNRTSGHEIFFSYQNQFHR